MFKKQRLLMGLRAAIMLAVVFGYSASTPHVLAAEKSNAANTLKVSPVRSDIEVKAGETKTVQVIVTNLIDAPVMVKPITNDFVAGDERGTPALILDANQYAPTHSLKKFMQPLKDVTIAPKSGKIIDVVITVPKDAPAGGYFGAVRFAPSDPDDGGEVNLSASVASLILMTVPGPSTEKLDLTDFQIQQKGANGTIFRTPDNLQLTFRFASGSNVQVAPFGKISVKKGDRVVYQADFNDKTPRDMILPDSTRRWDIPLKNIEGFFGHYTVHATLTYGKTNQTVEVKKDFWIISWLAIAIAGAVLLILIILTIIIILAVRRKKRRTPRRTSFSGGANNGYRR